MHLGDQCYTQNVFVLQTFSSTIASVQLVGQTVGKNQSEESMIKLCLERALDKFSMSFCFNPLKVVE